METELILRGMGNLLRSFRKKYGYNHSGSGVQWTEEASAEGRAVCMLL
jgi:hypothetical protein